MGTLQDLEHHIMTAYETSESFVHSYSPIPFQGIYKGNGSGPTIQVAVSAPLVERMLGAGHGRNLDAPLSCDKNILVVFMFVDYTDILEVDLTKTEITIEDVYIIIQKNINIW